MTHESDEWSEPTPAAVILGSEAREARDSIHSARLHYLSIVVSQMGSIFVVVLGLLAAPSDFGVVAVGLGSLVALEFVRRRSKRKFDRIRAVAEELDRALEAGAGRLGAARIRAPDSDSA